MKDDPFSLEGASMLSAFSSDAKSEACLKDLTFGDCMMKAALSWYHLCMQQNKRKIFQE